MVPRTAEEKSSVGLELLGLPPPRGGQAGHQLFPRSPPPPREPSWVSAMEPPGRDCRGDWVTRPDF